MVRRVAIINGSGQSYISQALAQGADCILTGDTTYHNVQELEEMGVAVIDPGHFASEQSVFFKIMKSMAKEFVKETGIPIYFSEAEKDPYAFYCK
jgi:putative NIF3 family GTP cyclohydrolase 1 type 2